MRCIVAGHEAVTAAEFAELAFGIDLELFAGPAVKESEEDRSARLDVAREVLADLRTTDPEAAAYAEFLLRRSPLKLQPVVRRARRSSQRRRNVPCAAGVGVAA
ncbi:hypothetical protein [Streptomyces sp. AC555_RSS877]|uniref:hypothetical protein n=1 Tax=Streptomyces sp. AC555_RSS877 TaxID=2823688 RepID=UPI001C251932|nr:hypothetical protein [Streptomyces sp. AC555_RSS877]